MDLHGTLYLLSPWDVEGTVPQNIDEFCAVLSSLGQAVCQHIVSGDKSEFSDEVVDGNGLLDLDYVSNQPLVLSCFNVVHSFIT